MYHLGPAGPRARLPAARLPRLGHRRPQQPHQRLLGVAPAPATRSGTACDRPSPDHANARFILLLSSHLETGHYFNPHAQRIIEGKMRGRQGLRDRHAPVSNTASMADYWLSPWPGIEAALLLAMAHVLLRERRYDREFVRRWVNWEEYLREERPDLPVTFDAFERALDELYARVHAGVRRAGERRRPPRRIVEVAREIGARRLARSPPTSGATPPPATSAAGRWRARSSSSSSSSGAVATPGRHRAQRLEQGDPGAADDAAARARSGASCYAARSTRSPSSR